MKELKIDSELRDLLPPLTDEEYKQLEKNIVENGFDKNFPIMVWHDFVVDGHNRYEICRKHKIDFVYGNLGYETKEEVMEWMLDIQLGRRNLSPIQRIAIAEKYRHIYEIQAKENKSKAGGDKKSDNYKKSVTENLPQANNENKERNPTTDKKLSDMAGVSEKTYRMGTKILNSNNEEVKNAVLSGEMSINAGYNKIRENKKVEDNNVTTTTIQSTVAPPTPPTQSKPQISEEVRQICENLKTERSKEYLDSIWDYKIDIIECMNTDFERFYDGFVSTLEDMENRVTKRELNECIANAENMVEKMLSAIEIAKNTILKTED